MEKKFLVWVIAVWLSLAWVSVSSAQNVAQPEVLDDQFPALMSWMFDSSIDAGYQQGVGGCPSYSASFLKSSTAEVTLWACTVPYPTDPGSQCDPVSEATFSTTDIDGPAPGTTGAPYIVPQLTTAETSGTSQLHIHCTNQDLAVESGGTFSGDASDIDFPSPVGGQTEVNAWAVQTEATFDETPPVDISTAASPAHVIYDDRQNWFALDGVKAAFCGTSGVLSVPKTVCSTAADCSGVGGTCSVIEKTKSISEERRQVNLTPSESFLQWHSLISGGDTDPILRHARTWGHGGSKTLGDEGPTVDRLRVADRFATAIGTLGTGGISAATGTVSLIPVGITETEATAIGVGTLLTLTGTETLVDIDGVPSGVISSAGEVAAGYSSDGNHSTIAWDLADADILSTGVDGTDWCFLSDKSLYTNEHGVESRHPLKVASADASTITTEWIGQGVDGHHPFAYRADVGAGEGILARCVEVVDLVFSDDDYIPDQVLVAKSGTWTAAETAEFKVSAYGNFRSQVSRMTASNALGRRVPDANLILANDLDRGRNQISAGLRIKSGGDLANLTDGNDQGFGAGVECDEDGCETGLHQNYAATPGQSLAEMDVPQGRIDGGENVLSVDVLPTGTGGQSLDLTVSRDGWGMNGDQFVRASTIPSSMFDACRDGAIEGFNANSDGRYSLSCPRIQKAGVAFVTCTAEGVSTAGADDRCWAAGERLIVDGALDALVDAMDDTQIGGTVAVPLFAGFDSAIYVYEGCDLGTCPTLNTSMSSIDPRQNQANRTGFIAATHGRGYVGEAECSVDPITRKRGGVCFVDNSNASKPGAVNNNWIFRAGASAGSRLCVPTSATDPTCDLDAAEVTSFDPTHSLMGVNSELRADILEPTDATGGYLNLCVGNDFAASHATTLGVCQGDPRIRATVAGAAARTSAIAGGCDFGVGGDLGPAVGFADYVEYLVETLGEQTEISVTVNNFEFDGDSATNGSKSVQVPVNNVGATCDGGNGRLIAVGNPPDAPNGLFRWWDFDNPDMDPAALTINKVQIVDNAVRELGNRYTYQNIGFAANNYRGRDSSVAAGDCLTGAEPGCDDYPLVGILSSKNGGLNNALLYGCSDNSAKSCIEGQVESIGAKIHDITFRHSYQGLLSDMGLWEFRNVLVEDVFTESGLFQFFVPGATFRDLTIRNTRALYAFASAYSDNLLVSGVTLHGASFDSAYARLRQGANIRFTDHYITGLSGHFATIAANSTSRTGPITIDHIYASSAHNAPAISTGFGLERSKSFIAITTEADTQLGQIGPIYIDNVHVEAEPRSILVHFDAGSDGVAGGGTAAERGVEDYMHRVSITNSSLESQLGGLISFFRATTGNYLFTGDLDYRTASRRPRVENLWLDDAAATSPDSWAPLEDFAHSQSLAADFGDCGSMTQGSVVSVYDDTAVGACTDADANGVLDGGGSAQSTCVCDPDGDAGDGVWFALHSGETTQKFGARFDSAGDGVRFSTVMDKDATLTGNGSCLHEGSTVPNAQVISIAECNSDGVTCGAATMTLTATGGGSGPWTFSAPSDAALDAGDYLRMYVDGVPTTASDAMTCTVEYRN